MKLSISIFSALIVIIGFSSFQNINAQQDELDKIVVKAYFVGYDENDIIFRIQNTLDSSIVIKGLSYKRQILYRPIERDIEVSIMSEESPFQDILFRSTGDFIWSQNHMDQFQLAYQLMESSERHYTKIFPNWKKSDQLDGLVHESKQ